MDPSGRESQPPPSHDSSLPTALGMLIDRHGSPTFTILLKTALYECTRHNIQGQWYVPRGEMSRILHVTAIQRVLSEYLASVGEEEAARYARIICGKDGGSQKSFLQIFCIMLMLEMVDDILAFVDAGLDDSQLPMPASMSDLLSASNDYTGEQHSRWRRIAQMWKPHQLHDFFKLQWSVLTPVFVRADEVRHYIFSEDVVLPFLVPDPGQENGSSKSGGSILNKYSGFGSVRRIKLDPEYYDFGDYLNRESNFGHIFALKQLYTNDENDVWREANLLKRFRHVDHIIQLLATFEVRRYDIRIYNFLFPCGSGTLEHLWEAKTPSPVGDSRITLWLAEQCYALANALSAIHHDTNDSALEDTEAVFGIHGDIKPENILWFEDHSVGTHHLGTLVLADFGLGSLHKKSSRFNVPTESMARSATYRAPEFDVSNSEISRSIDIWSMGCVFVETITWLVYGYTSLQNFRDSRLSTSSASWFEEDCFFSIDRNNDRVTGKIKSQVTDWIQSLHRSGNCNDFIHDFLDIVERGMLVIDRRSRMQASELSQRLLIIYRKCQEDIAYYQESRPWTNIASGGTDWST